MRKWSLIFRWTNWRGKVYLLLPWILLRRPGPTDSTAAALESHVDICQRVSVARRIMFHKRRHHIHLLLQSLGASEPAHFRLSFFSTKSFTSKSNVSSDPYISPCSDRPCRGDSEESSSCSKCCFMVRMGLSLQPTYLDCPRRDGTALSVQGGQPISQRGGFPRYFRAIFSRRHHKLLTNGQLWARKGWH